jgi:hypothetical protein
MQGAICEVTGTAEDVTGLLTNANIVLVFYTKDATKDAVPINMNISKYS